MAPGSFPHAHTFMPLEQSPPGPAATAGCTAAAATTNSDANTNFFIRPSDMQKTACAGSLFESGQTKALSLMIYDKPARPGTIARDDVANERRIMIQSPSGLQ
jgi:hypothetical protein